MVMFDQPARLRSPEKAACAVALLMAHEEDGWSYHVVIYPESGLASIEVRDPEGTPVGTL